MSGLGNFNPLSRASFTSREQEFHEIAIRGVDGYDNFGFAGSTVTTTSGTQATSKGFGGCSIHTTTKRASIRRAR